MQCLGHVHRRARCRFLGEQRRHSLAQGAGAERRGERRQHRQAVFLADLLHRLDDDRLAGADGENLAAELPAHQDFKNFAGLDSVDRHSENDEIRKLGLEYRRQVIGLGAFAGYEAEIFKHVGQECAKVFLAVRNAGPRRHLPASEGGGWLVVEHLMCHR